jgi:hypothetical protein
MDGIPALLVVLGAQIAVYLIPPLIVARRLIGPSTWPVWGWGAFFLGISSQAILGLLWGHLVHRAPGAEALVWLTGWLIVSLICLTRTAPPSPAAINHRLELKTSLILGAILATGFLLRTLHPLQHEALGQSDAYSHLQFIQEVVETGQIGNRLYPPGHAWVLGLPALLFNLDPYIMARYGGALFGLGLILAVYTLVRTTTHKPTPALIAAFLAGCFPAFNILHKTSVGVFANQMGLFLVPSLLALYLLWRNTGFKWGALAIGFSAGLAAMMVSTPIMLIHLLIIGGVERLTSCLRDGRYAVRTVVRLLVVLVPAALLMTFHIGQANTQAIGVTFQILGPQTKTGGPAALPPVLKTPDVPSLLAERTPPQPVLRESCQRLSMLSDFFTFKRFGFHDWLFNLAGLTLLSIFVICFAYGWQARIPLFSLLGIWGGLTTIQTVTGWLQFSMYQREGWSLLIAVIILAGLMGGLLWDHLYRFAIARFTLFAGLAVSLGLAFLNPPGHSSFTSTAEDDLVCWVKRIAAHCRPSAQWPPARTTDRSKQPILDAIKPGYAPVLITRKMAGWSSGQGELAHVIGRGMPSLTFEPASGPAPVLAPHRQYIFLLESQAAVSPAPSSISRIMRKMQPDMVKLYDKVRSNESSSIREIERFIAENGGAPWTVSRIPLTPRLNAVILTPASR